MKRYIDLFKQQGAQNKSLSLLHKVKKIGLIALFILVSIAILEGGAFWYLSTQARKQESVKKRFNAFIIQNQVFDSKINYFVFKYDLLKQYLSKDANVSYYYGLLDAFLSEIDSTAQISLFSLKNDQSVKFSLRFDTYEQAIEFMSRIETEKMSDYFETLTLKDFTISNKDMDGYILEFEGTFKKVTNATQT
ncbi:hypothetical protein BH09PAT2_BH09PAT2_09480 [soil metagenome]